MRNKKLGFTLIELLVVVVIVVLVVVFAVPSFKKAQENSKNQRAQAVLLDIAGAVKNFRVYEEVPKGGSTAAFGPVTQGTFAGSGEGSALYQLVKDNLLKPIPWDQHTDRQYNGYIFYVCSDSFADGCCGAAADTVAAMQAAVAGTGRFNSSSACAWVNEQGDIKNNYDPEASIL